MIKIILTVLAFSTTCAFAQNKDGSAFNKPVVDIRPSATPATQTKSIIGSTSSVVTLGSYMQYPSELFSTDWASQRENWTALKREKLGNLDNMPKMDRLKAHYNWLLYLNPTNPYHQYFKLEEQFFIALEAQEWDSTRVHSSKLWGVLEQFPEEPRQRAKMLYYTVLQGYPEDAIGGDYLWRANMLQMEQEGKWLELAQYFLQENNPRRSFEIALGYVRKYTQKMDALDAYRFERTWLLRLDPSEQGVWFRDNESKPWMSWWWVTQYQAFCQSKGGYLTVDQLGLPTSSACTSR